MICKFVVKQIDLRLDELAKWAIDEWSLHWPLAASPPHARAELSSDCRIRPFVPVVVSVLEIIQAALDRLHLAQKLDHVLAVPWTNLALLEVALASALLPRVPAAIAWAACWSRCRRR